MYKESDSSLSMPTPSVRMRRLRATPALRAMVREHHVVVTDLIYPLFVKANSEGKAPIASMPGQYQWSLDALPSEVDAISALGISAVLLFGLPAYKDAQGSAAQCDDGIVQQAIRGIKAKNADMTVMADLCFCEYTDHGHCGVLHAADASLGVDNDATLALLVEQAVSLAQAGVDVIAPSGMMDGMVRAVRWGLDQAGYHHIPIMSYAVKYASSFYGPFREAAGGEPSFGDRKQHQMDPANAARGIREAQLDIEEGADLLIIKPGMPYLDMLARLKDRFEGIPLVAYQVSGEFAMIKAAAKQGALDERAAVLESMLCCKRAGADMMITYFAKELAQWLADGNEYP